MSLRLNRKQVTGVTLGAILGESSHEETLGEINLGPMDDP
jgi:hypothetical protein